MKKVRRWLVNIFLILLLLLGLLLIFNKGFRNMIMAWNANKYQVTKIDKKTLKQNNRKGIGMANQYGRAAAAILAAIT